MSYNYEDEVRMSEEEQKMTLQEFETDMKKKYSRGKVIVVTIIIIELVLTLISTILNFVFADVITLFVTVSFSIALYFGVLWVRYFYIVIYIISAIRNFTLFGEIISLNSNNLAVIISGLLVFLVLVYRIAAAYLLLKNESVKEFLYTQRKI